MYNDGFNERNNYVRNSVDKNKLNKMNHNNVDSSLAQMHSTYHKNDVKTVNTDKVEIIPEVQGNKENFILRNTNIINAQNMFRK